MSPFILLLLYYIFGISLDVCKLYIACVISPSTFLIGHEESYNPPPEYLLNEDEVFILLQEYFCNIMHNCISAVRLYVNINSQFQ